MKLSRLILAIFWVAALPAEAAIALVAHTAAGAASQEAPAITRAIHTLGADFIAIGATTYGQDSSHIVISDSNGNTWTRLNNYVDGSNRGNSTIFYCLNPITSADHTFAAIAGALGYVSIAVTAWSGVAVQAAFDAQNGNGGDYVTSLSTNAVSPSEGNSLVITIVSGQPQLGSPSWSITPPFTVVDAVDYSPTMHTFIADAYEVQSAATPRDITWTAANGVNVLASTIIAVFKAGKPVVVPLRPIWIY